MKFSVLPVRDELAVRPGRIFIDGNWRTEGEGRFDQIHPSTNEVVTSIVEAGVPGVNDAVAAARKAFDSGPWQHMGARERRILLQRVIAGIQAAEEELAQLHSLDNGLPIQYSRNARLSPRNVADVFEHYAGWIDKIHGETHARHSDALNMQFMTFREPVGVVAAIAPFNAILLIFALKVAPALACGNTVVMKPSELTNLATLRLAEIIAEADLPPGVFNLVTGGPVTGEALSTHPGVDKVSFTGSPVVGEKILSTSGRNMKRVTLELGGKSAALVFPDARSVKTAASTLMGLCSTFLSGQVCSTPTRALVHRSVLDEFVEHARVQAASIKRGSPFDPSTTSAPIISKRQVDRIMSYIDVGRREGATLQFGGDRPGGDLADGNWIDPTLFVNVDNKSRIAREEIFGPVLCVTPFDSEDEAIALANDSEYGLSGGIYTTDISRAFRVARRMRTGSIGINGYSAVPNAPMGGIKRSGIGREGGWETIEEFTELKTVMLNLDA
jgi:aldehyde dehydrogenase (NAD+)